MRVEMCCGTCGSSLLIEDDSSERDEAIWVLGISFSNAHAGCGFVLETPEPEKAPRMTVPRRSV